MRTTLLAVILLAAISPVQSYAQDNHVFILYGYITNENSRGLTNATVRTQNNRHAIADTAGYYEIRLPSDQLSLPLQIVARHVGKQTYRKALNIPENVQSYRHDIVLKDLNLYLDEISVTAERSNESVSNSTYVIDRAAIEQSQTYTLGDLLQLIPGQSITNPSLQGAQSITFRSEATGSHALNNAFGIGLYLNGNNLNNNANMQSLNPITNGTGLGSFGGSRSETGIDYTEGFSPGGGFDLRELPVGNIEEVEIVQGVASAKYGDITEGGIFIETLAGRSPWNISLRRSGGEINAGIDKGFQLHPRHEVNMSVDYLYSNADPRDRVKSYNRLSTSLLWTSYYGEEKQIRNTLSLSYRQNLDDFKTDPDLGPIEITYYQNKRLSLSNRLRVQSNNILYDNLNFSVSANMGNSKSLLDEFINPGVQPVIAVTEEGVHEGTYHPASYRSQRKILGKPISLGSRLSFNRAMDFNDWQFNLTYGGNVSFDANYGDGRVFDPLRPVPRNRAVSRPVSYRELDPKVFQGGVYIENTITGDIGGHRLNTSIGLRGDIQHGYQTLSPRINARFHLTDNFSLTGAYGLQTKAPGLIHLYPGPDYHDYTLLNSYTGKVNESIYLAYTRISKPESDDLQPMKSYRSELGLQWQPGRFRLATTVYRNISTDGISRASLPEYLDLPVYEIVEQNPGEEPVIRDTGETEREIYEQAYFSNSLYTRSWGVQVSAHTPKIERIQTSFSLNLSYTNSYYYDQSRNIRMGDSDPQPTEEIWFGIYPPNKSRGGRAQGRLTSVHHISDLGLLLTIRSEAFLYNYSELLDQSNRAVAYVNNELDIIPIAADEVDDPRFDKLDQKPEEGTFSQRPTFVYFNFHANVSKNIGESVRLSFFANNFLNLRPRSDSESGSTRLNEQPYVGMELRLTL